MFFENLRLAILALRANKLRSILTTLGIIIGVAAVIAVVSIVQGLQFVITKELQGMGATYIKVDREVPDQGPGLVARQVKLTWEDGQAIRDQVLGVRRITPIVRGFAEVKYRDRKYRPGAILGANQDYQEVQNHAVEQGRFFSRIDLDNRRNVAVVGPKVAEELALGPEPVGKEIYVGTYPATVVGVTEKKGRSFTGEDLDDLVLVPFDAAVALFGRNAGDQVELGIQARSTADVEQVKEGTARLLRRRHRLPPGQPDDFDVETQDELLKSVNQVLGSVTAVVGGVVGIALLVGGIGIMNIMLVSVTERTREIGVRKAVGARRQDVLLQFLIEAITLSLMGGAIGLAAGYGLGVAAAKLLPEWPPAHVPLWAVTVAFGFSALVGIFFGSYPAGKAARLDPIEALRYE